MTYYYHIVKDPETYQRYMESFASNEDREITEMSTFESYTTVEITEDGDVNITLQRKGGSVSMNLLFHLDCFFVLQFPIIKHEFSHVAFI